MMWIRVLIGRLRWRKVGKRAAVEAAVEVAVEIAVI